MNILLRLLELMLIRELSLCLSLSNDNIGVCHQGNIGFIKWVFSIFFLPTYEIAWQTMCWFRFKGHTEFQEWIHLTWTFVFVAIKYFENHCFYLNAFYKSVQAYSYLFDLICRLYVFRNLFIYLYFSTDLNTVFQTMF